MCIVIAIVQDVDLARAASNRHFRVFQEFYTIGTQLNDSKLIQFANRHLYASISALRDSENKYRAYCDIADIKQLY